MSDSLARPWMRHFPWCLALHTALKPLPFSCGSVMSCSAAVKRQILTLGLCRLTPCHFVILATKIMILGLAQNTMNCGKKIVD